MTSDNSKSQIDDLDLKIKKIKIQALLLLRFNLRFETLLFDSPAYDIFPSTFYFIVTNYFLKFLYFNFDYYF